MAHVTAEESPEARLASLRLHQEFLVRELYGLQAGVRSIRRQIPAIEPGRVHLAYATLTHLTGRHAELLVRLRALHEKLETALACDTRPDSPST